jgi:hypothetical protein
MKLIPVYSTEGQLEAEMIKGFLEAQGMNVVLSQESIGRTYGLTAGRLGQVKIFVPESQVEEAISILEAMERGEYEDIDLTDSQEEQ